MPDDPPTRRDAAASVAASATTAPQPSGAPPLDAVAMRAALAESHVACFGWAMACTGRRRHEAEDVLQAAYEKVLSGQARFEGRSSFKTWLFGVVRRTALEQRRRRWFAGVPILAALFGDEARADAPSPESAVAHDERTRAVARAIARLADQQRAVLHLVFYEEMTVREAAEAMGLSVGSVSVHYDRGKKNLAALLRAEGVMEP